jgi:predicted membrane channel-forming protein YqfA (hemolysin III family)
MKETMENHESEDLKYQLLGWILFIVCAIFFIASSLKNGDTLTFIGSIIFLIACIVFIMPLFRTIKKIENQTKTDDDKKLYNNSNSADERKSRG